MKKFLALLLVITLLCVMTGCVVKTEKDTTVGTKDTASKTEESEKEEKESKLASSGKLFDEPVEFSVMLISHPSWPYQDDWYIKKLVEEKTNVKLNVTALPSSNFNTKLSLDLAAGEYDDLINISGTTITHQYGPQGAFVNIKTS